MCEHAKKGVKAKDLTTEGLTNLLNCRSFCCPVVPFKLNSVSVAVDLRLESFELINGI